MEHPIFFATSCRLRDRLRALGGSQQGEGPDPGPTCQAAESAGIRLNARNPHQGEGREFGMAKKKKAAKGAKKKAAKKR